MQDTIPFSQAELQASSGAAFVPASLVRHVGAAFWCELRGQQRRLSILAGSGHPTLAHSDVYEQVLDRHFYRHLLPFAESSKK